MQRFWDAANGLTLVSLIAAFGSVILAMNGLTGLALIALIACGIIDLFDGFVARALARTEEQKRFGGILDSLVDACAFGFAPAAMLYCVGMNSLVEVLILVCLPLCVVWRVAYFEVVGLEVRQPVDPSGAMAIRYYTGLPATYVALALPAAALCGFLGETWFRWAMGSTIVGLCLAMVSTWKVRKPGLKTYLIFVVLAIVASSLLATYGAMLPNHFSKTYPSSAIR